MITIYRARLDNRIRPIPAQVRGQYEALGWRILSSEPGDPEVDRPMTLADALAMVASPVPAIEATVESAQVLSIEPAHVATVPASTPSTTEPAKRTRRAHP